MPNDLTIIFDPAPPLNTSEDIKILITASVDGNVLLYLRKVLLQMSPDLALNISKGLYEKAIELKSKGIKKQFNN